jgi:hypothetical protein
MTETPQEIASQIKAYADENGATVTIKGNEIATVHSTFEPGDRDAYVKAEMVASHILMLIPMNRPGSVWGTDGATIGGHAGLTGGYMRLNKSGIAKRVGSAITKAFAA